MLEGVLRKMERLEDGASLEEVDRVLSGKRLTARDFTTVLSKLKARKAWRVALLVGEWLQRRSMSAAGSTSAPERPQPLPNRAHYQVILGACAAAGAAVEAQQLADQMASHGVPVDATVISTLVLANERTRNPRRTAELLEELEAMIEVSHEASPSAEADSPSAQGASHKRHH